MNAVEIKQLSHSYPPPRKQKEPRIALSNVSFSIEQGEIFCLLGPNGSGKSTLFKIISTLIQPSSGVVKILDLDLAQQADEVRRLLGVVFQHPSLDIKLTARENLMHQGHLYGISGDELNNRMDAMLQRVGLADRAHDLVEHLSGGNQRRIELVKGLLHKPKLLVLDEPSTGIDPGARREFMTYLKQLRDEYGVTIVLTTHILDEAEACDRIGIMDKGTLVAIGSPSDLKKEIGGDVISLTSPDSEELSKKIESTFQIKASVVNDTVRIERENGHEFIPQLVQSFPGLINTVTLSKPTLEDVFIHKTGHKFWLESDNEHNQ